MDAFIDPVLRDYSIVNGAPLRDPAAGLANAAYLRLATPLGSYWADPTLGSRLDELQREKDVARVGILAKQFAEQALAPIVSDGRAMQINVSTGRPGNGWLYLLVEIIALGGESMTFKYPVKVL